MRVYSIICITFCAMVLSIAGCQNVHIEPDDRPVMQLELDEPYELQFGRGSGMAGLNTIVIKPSGRVILYRRLYGWETAEFEIDSQTQRQILELIDDYDLLHMGRLYSNENIKDGTQWAFWLTQGDGEKTIYLNNDFPSDIVGFAEDLDEALKAAGSDRVTWTPLGPHYNRNHEDALWEAT